MAAPPGPDILCRQAAPGTLFCMYVRYNRSDSVSGLLCSLHRIEFIIPP